ncbi:MAG: hypothetical protein VYA34_02910 [Myxococcota bacterium]|nr:hypothetical protein [Myxococcota bacterium]
MTLIRNTQPTIASTRSSSVPPTGSRLLGCIASKLLCPRDLAIEVGLAVAKLGSGAFLHSVTSTQPRNPIRETRHP